MKLYLIERTDEVGYDEYGGHVIAAESPEDALAMARWEATVDSAPTVKFIGIAADGILAGPVLSSFRAG